MRGSVDYIGFPRARKGFLGTPRTALTLERAHKIARIFWVARVRTKQAEEARPEQEFPWPIAASARKVRPGQSRRAFPAALPCGVSRILSRANYFRWRRGRSFISRRF